MIGPGKEQSPVETPGQTKRERGRQSRLSAETLKLDIAKALIKLES